MEPCRGGVPFSRDFYPHRFSPGEGLRPRLTRDVRCSLPWAIRASLTYNTPVNQGPYTWSVTAYTTSFDMIHIGVSFDRRGQHWPTDTKLWSTTRTFSETVDRTRSGNENGSGRAIHKATLCLSPQKAVSMPSSINSRTRSNCVAETSISQLTRPTSPFRSAKWCLQIPKP